MLQVFVLFNSDSGDFIENLPKYSGVIDFDK